MKITTKKKVYTALLAVGLAGLWLDKGFGGASPADASPATAELAPADGAAPGFRSAATGVSLVSELKGMSSGNFDPLSAHDAFVPAKYWTAACINAATPTHAQTTASEFQRDHRLSALMLSGHGGQAIINGQLVRVGHTIDGFKLVAIGPNRATLLNGEILVELHMESPAATIDSISTR
jgi:hypothetical protein